MKVFLDGMPVQYPNTSLLKPTYTFRRSTENREQSVGFTGELTFEGTDYDYVYAKLVTDANAINQYIILTLENDCCPDEFGVGLKNDFVIKPESLKWCTGSCSIQATALEYTPDGEAYRCVNNTLIWDDFDGFQSKHHPRVPYCLEFRPSILQDAMLIFGLCTVSMSAVLYPLFLTAQTIVNTINLIIGFINGIGGSLSTISIAGQAGNMSILNWAQGLNNTISAFVVGCNYDHPSPFVRDYIQNVCKKCNLTFSSSIYNEADPSKPNYDYYQTVYFSAQIRKGQSAGDYFGGLANYIGRNKPIHNGKTFLDEIVQPMNAQWDIHNGVLRLERRDFFSALAPWLDLTTYPKEKILDECFEWTKNPRNAYGDFGYSKDGMDWVGDEAIERWGDIVEWNSPPSPLQKGAFTRVFPFGGARFRGDRLDRDVLSDYGWMPFGMGIAINANRDVLLMNNGMAFMPKLLILRGGYDTDHALIENKWAVPPVPDRDNVHLNAAYNYPFWIREGAPGNLYDRFWYIENPRYATFAGKDVNIIIEYDCDTLRAINIDGTVRCSNGKLAANLTVTVDEDKTRMQIKGTL